VGNSQIKKKTRQNTRSSELVKQPAKDRTNTRTKTKYEEKEKEQERDGKKGNK